jgi:hypothetical protein
VSRDRFDDVALNLTGWMQVRSEPAGASGAFWFVAGPRRTSKNVAESDIATMRKSIADYLRLAVDQAAAPEDKPWPTPNTKPVGKESA